MPSRLHLVLLVTCRCFFVRSHQAGIGPVLSTLCLLVAQSSLPRTVADVAQRPNVVIILADDQACGDFGFMGNAHVYTPNIDQLAQQSARYRHGYVPMSVCRPSLATILTGLYPHQHGIHFNHPPPGLAAMQRDLTGAGYRRIRATTDHLIENIPTLPRLLAAQGYACLQTGKHWEGSFRTAGFTHGMTTGLPADRLSPITGTRTQANGDWVAHGNGDAGLVIGRETMQPIDSFVAQHALQRPFLIWYAPFLPHTPFDAPPRFQQLAARPDVPEYLRPYYAQIAMFDETVGHLLKTLQQHQVLHNTLIVFASDNGFRPRADNPDRQDRRSKLSQFENGLRTPILLRLEDRIVPADHSQLVHTIDLLPTILSATGLGNLITTEMQGTNLMPSATGQQSLPERSVFGAIYPNDARTLRQPSMHVRGKWVRHGDFKLIIPGPQKPALPLSLFDLNNDPNETNNLAQDPEYKTTVIELTQKIQQWWPH